MAATHSWTLTVKPVGLPSLPADQATLITGDYSIDIDETVLAGATKEVFSGSIDHTKILSYVLHSSQAAASVDTGQTFSLGAAKAQGWNNTTMPGISNPITQTITVINVSNGDTKDTVFRASFLMSAA
jgi:hypothetical protein